MAAWAGCGYIVPMAIDICIQPLVPESFTPYGNVLDLNAVSTRSINAGTSDRLDLPAALDLDRGQGRPALAVFRARRQPEQGPWLVLERHRFGSQTFIPLDGARCLLLVALGGGQPDPDTLAAFEAEPRRGFTLHAGTWHHPLIALDDGDFLVIERAGPAVDCEVRQLADPVHLVRSAFNR
jgi:ureidoglycolate lyase